MNVLDQLRKRFQTALASLVEDPAPFSAMVKPAQDARFGDFQANCAMPLSKQKRANPRDVAVEIVERLDLEDLCETPEIAGPGFINLRLKDTWLEQAALQLVQDSRLGHDKIATPRTFVVDFSAPNVAKPMHVGHLRSTVIGDSVCRLLRFQGHEVIGDNHIGDWGTQFGMLIFGYKHFLDEEAFAQDAVGELARLYRLVNQLSHYHSLQTELPCLRRQLEQSETALRKFENRSDEDRKDHQQTAKKRRADLFDLTDRIKRGEATCAAIDQDPQLKSLAAAYPDIAADARTETAKLHAGDEKNRRLWERFVPCCLDALSKMYRRLRITFDLSLGESFYQPSLSDVVADLQARNLAKESEGAVCAFIEGNDAPLIIRKGDGAFTYATTDLATIKYRHDELQADAILYVVDARQSEHFRLVFEIARQWGYDNINFQHVRFGTVLGRDRKPFKTRSGDTVGLESLLDEAVARARIIVDENDDAKPDGPELDETTRAAVAEIVGTGGIKYADLNHNRESDYVFDWDKMLAKNGDTATYIQYAFARICGIFRKGGIDRTQLRNVGQSIHITKPSERSLILQLIRFPEAIDSAAGEYRPNLMTQYLFETANCFSAFYNECQVLKEPNDECRTTRLLLCHITAQLLELGLSLLGIEVSERM